MLLKDPGREEQQQQTMLQKASLSLRFSLQPAFKLPGLLILGTGLSLAHLSFYLCSYINVVLVDCRELNHRKLEPGNSERPKWIA